jgi:hypothetical protein
MSSSDPIRLRPTVPRYLVVPTEPGPLLDPAPGAAGAEASDEAERPSWLDPVLVAAGLVIAAWGWIGANSTVVIALGAALAAFGAAFALLRGLRRAAAGRAERARAAVLARGPLLDADHPITAALVAAYDELLDAAETLRSAAAAEARAAGHAAMLETAYLLEGRPPASPGEARYVRKRVRAIVALTAALTATPDASVMDPRREARTEAHAELDRIGASSLTELADLTEALRRGS